MVTSDWRDIPRLPFAAHHRKAIFGLTFAHAAWRCARLSVSTRRARLPHPTSHLASW
jgi:hypothetical protein